MQNARVRISHRGAHANARHLVFWTERAWEDYLHWHKTDQKVLEKINTLIKDIEGSPFKGLGKPEALKHALAGWWSRRITDKHRLVYRVSGKAAQQVLEIAQRRYHC
jgi:toxin YoeB